MGVDLSSLASTAINILLHGVAYAMILYIVTVGLSVTMGLMGFANLAHGVFAMAGGYVLTRSMQHFGVPFELGLVLSFVLVAAGSVVIERMLYRPLYTAGELEQVLLSIGLIFISMAAATFLFGPQTEQLSLPGYLRGSISIGERLFPSYRAFLICACVAVIALLWVAIDRTSIGAKVRAAVDNTAMAEAIGINTDRLFTLTFALGSGLAGLGGAMGAEILPIHPSYALQYLVIFLMVVSIGGLGSLKGPLVAALVLGIGDTTSKFLIPDLGAFFVYVATVAVLLWRPHGLFGRAWDS
jgi:branched-chain amino acid transport system permease protein